MGRNGKQRDVISGENDEMRLQKPFTSLEKQIYLTSAASNLILETMKKLVLHLIITKNTHLVLCDEWWIAMAVGDVWNSSYAGLEKKKKTPVEFNNSCAFRETGNLLVSPSYLDSLFVWEIVASSHSPNHSSCIGKQFFFLYNFTEFTRLHKALLQKQPSWNYYIRPINCHCTYPLVYMVVYW